MNRIKLNDSVSLSRIVHGQWRLWSWDRNPKELLYFIESIVDRGITSFDHADIYGDYTCEELFGDALYLNPSLRYKIELITKCTIKRVNPKRPTVSVKHYDTSKEHIIWSVENSLKNFKTETLDVMLLHRPDPFMNPEEVAEAFELLFKSGKVKSFGVSNYLPSDYNMLNSYLSNPLVTNQIEISISNLTQFETGTISHCLENRIHPMAWSPLDGGKLIQSEDEKYIRIKVCLEKIKNELGVNSISQIAYAWLLAHPSKIIPIVGSGKMERVQDAIDALDIKISREQWFELWKSSTGKDVV